jgi:N-acetylglucosaminyldiphosphoundecaprenol N-acetyl-beta-D-mannosaminyltransferase
MNNVSNYALETRTFMCRGCGSSQHQFLCGRERFLKSEQELMLCGECGLAYLTPDFTDEALTRFYTQDYRRLSLIDAVAYPDTEFFRQLLSREFARLRVAEIAPHLPPGATLLEIGSGFGAFLGELHHTRPDVTFYASEMDVAHRHQLLGETSVQFVDTEALPTNIIFDAIVLIHTLEHLKDPVGILHRCAHALKPNGRIYIEVPDSSADWGNWLYVLPAHLSYFSAASLTRTLAYAGIHPLVVGAHPAGASLASTLWAVGTKTKITPEPATPATPKEITVFMNHIAQYRWNAKQALRHRLRGVALRMLGPNRLGAIARWRFYRAHRRYFEPHP